MTAEALDIDLGFDEPARSPAVWLDFSKLKLEHLWEHHESLKASVRETYAEIGRIEQELERRALAARPDFTAESGGGVEIAGEHLVIGMSYDRDYEYDEEVIARLPVLEELTVKEYGELVKYTPKVNGTVYNRLLKRGGRLAEVLTGMRRLKSSRPKFTPRERVA